MNPGFSVQDFPALNATLNGLAGLFLLLGLVMIKRGKKKAHGGFMIAALVASAAFLACYLTYHYLKAGVVTRFPEEFVTARKVYLAILISHSLLAMINLPMVIVTVVFAARRRFESHKRIARWTYPIWLYVSITGVLVYFMLYQWFPATASVGESGGENAAATLQAGHLVFDPAIFDYEAEPGEKEVTATFSMKNTGPEVVTIMKLDTSCSCLKIESDKMKLRQGDVAELVAVFDIAKSTGPAEKLVYVYTDAKGASENRLVVRVEVPPVFSIEPEMMEWTVGDKLETKEIVFKVVRDEPVRILEAVSSRENMECELKTIEEGREYRLALTPKSTGDIMLGMVRILTDCELEQYQRPMAFFAVKRGSKELGK